MAHHGHRQLGWQTAAVESPRCMDAVDGGDRNVVVERHIHARRVPMQIQPGRRCTLTTRAPTRQTLPPASTCAGRRQKRRGR